MSTSTSGCRRVERLPQTAGTLGDSTTPARYARGLEGHDHGHDLRAGFRIVALIIPFDANPCG
jgi:hypothetical protein